MVNPTYIPTKHEILLEKHCQTYQQKKIKGEKQRTKGCMHNTYRYENMHSEYKKARIEQVTANHESKRITTCKESITMLNSTYITTQLEVRTSTLNARQAETQRLLHRRSGQFSANRKSLSNLLIFHINWNIQSTS
jgi:hypothetical protein